jgi:hypothetical protein
MDFVNKTKMKAGWTMGFDRDGRELVIIAVKATFTNPLPGQEAKLAEEQAPLVEADVFTGEPGFSAPLYECDYAHRKPRCDVLLNGSAYAPAGNPTERTTVLLQIGSLTKSFEVVGNRVWQAGALYIAVSKPEPFTVMPISYNNAWGGVDRSQEDPAKHHFIPSITRVSATTNTPPANTWTASRCPTPRNGAARSVTPRENIDPWRSALSAGRGSLGQNTPGLTIKNGWMNKLPSGRRTLTTVTFSRPPRTSRCRIPLVAKK